ncbi:MAG: ATP-grasp domain-containing protein [Oscillospiraceae bacterium]|nr:ATP-grasp domain-containing protein [Oscillospiraceae bacterium]
MKVIITGCGRHSKNLVQSLKHNADGREVEVIGINNSPVNILRSEVDKAIIAPSITDPSYIDWLLALCTSEQVDVILPYITAELPILAANREKLESSGTKVSVASEGALQIANDKLELARLFPEYMPCQTAVHSSEEIRCFAKHMGYWSGTQLCCKLADKCGGTGFAILDEKRYLDIGSFGKIGVNRYLSIDQLCEIADKVNADIILQEYVPGTDYSVCVLADHGKVELCCGFAGYAMEYGAVTQGEILKNDQAYAIAVDLTSRLNLDGNACFDFIIRADGSPVLLECNPRISATVPFIAEAGADLVYLRCKQLLGEPIDTNISFDYGLKMVKYYDACYYH